MFSRYLHQKCAHTFHFKAELGIPHRHSEMREDERAMNKFFSFHMIFLANANMSRTTPPNESWQWQWKWKRYLVCSKANQHQIHTPSTKNRTKRQTKSERQRDKERERETEWGRHSQVEWWVVHGKLGKDVMYKICELSDVASLCHVSSRVSFSLSHPLLSLFQSPRAFRSLAKTSRQPS